MQGSPAARISEFGRSLPSAWRRLGTEQRLAAVGSILLIVSTFGPFSFVEGAEILTALGVLLLLKRRADGVEFHLPFGDGTVIAAAGAWCALLILVRLFDRPLGQSVLALACAALVIFAGLRERAKRPMDDLPPETVKVRPDLAETERKRAADYRTEPVRDDPGRTEPLGGEPGRTEPLPGLPARPGEVPRPEDPPEYGR